LRLDPRHDAGCWTALVTAARTIFVPQPHVSEICTARAI
jgi:hypothetical protein